MHRRDRRGSDLGQMMRGQAFEAGPDADSGVESLSVEVDVAAGALDREIDIRVSRHEAGQPRNQPCRCEHRKYLEPQPLASGLAQRRRSHPRQFGKGPAGRGGEDIAIRGRLDGTMGAHEQRNPERLLEVADTVTDGGWAQIEQLRRSLEAAHAHRDIEGLQRQQL